MCPGIPDDQRAQHDVPRHLPWLRAAGQQARCPWKADAHPAGAGRVPRSATPAGHRLPPCPAGEDWRHALQNSGHALPWLALVGISTGYLVWDPPAPTLRCQPWARPWESWWASTLQPPWRRSFCSAASCRILSPRPRQAACGPRVCRPPVRGGPSRPRPVSESGVRGNRIGAGLVLRTCLRPVRDRDGRDDCPCPCRGGSGAPLQVRSSPRCCRRSGWTADCLSAFCGRCRFAQPAHTLRHAGRRGSLPLCRAESLRAVLRRSADQTTVRTPCVPVRSRRWPPGPRPCGCPDRGSFGRPPQGSERPRRAGAAPPGPLRLQCPKPPASPPDGPPDRIP